MWSSWYAAINSVGKKHQNHRYKIIFCDHKNLIRSVFSVVFVGVRRALRYDIA